MTLYISRHATATTASHSTRAVRADSWATAELLHAPRIDPPLCNHVWQRHFEQTIRKEGQR
ncbi:multiple cyclophane-containing RiPP AmcA [Micromonospora sp. WMMA1923]|uniref:multiple cyclophane-containing RiPP AmcA n=1 Tax=Micromonospora sp. WMMA1923 TaxID=3404125 RepID=UPI003B9281AA